MARGKAKGAAAADGGPKGKTDYQVSQEAFVVLWQMADSLDDAETRFAAYAAEHGLPAMPAPIIAARASGYRKKGVALKMMENKRNRALVSPADLNALVEQVDGGKVKEPPAPPKPKR